VTHTLCGNFAAAHVEADDLAALGEAKGTLMWKAWGMLLSGCVLARTGKALGRSSKDRLRRRPVAVNGINRVDAVVAIISGKSL
jgi:hypothetical protein